jgi:hypothetical protein
VSQSGGGRDSDENCGQPHAPENAGAITFAPGTALRSADKARDAMPSFAARVLSCGNPMLATMARRLASVRAIFRDYHPAVLLSVAYSAIFVTTGQEQHGDRMKALTAVDAKHGFGRPIDLARAEPMAVAG